MNHLLNGSTHWCRRPEGGMCRMRAGSWPTPRDSHSTRWGLCCKSCTEHIHQQCHQSRTSRCSPDPSRGGAAAESGCDAACVDGADGARAASGSAACADGADGADGGDGADGARAASGSAASGDGGDGCSRICTTNRCRHSHSDTATSTGRIRSFASSFDMSLYPTSKE